jgi:hypothetical protein
MSELTKEEREKEMERLVDELISTDVCPLPIPTPKQYVPEIKLSKKYQMNT